MRIIFFAFLVTMLCSCDLSLSSDSDKPAKKRKGATTYSYACIDSALAGKPLSKKIEKATDVLRDLAVDEDDITDDMQSEYGDAFHKDAIENKTFVLLKDPAMQTRLDKALKDLLAARDNPSNIRYSIYALDDTTINAFTFGGHIYVTKAMYKRCSNSDALLYAIVGHEIGHSEKGHIKKTIQSMEAANKYFGEKNGQAIFQLEKVLTASFNQRNELEADYYGTDLTNNLNQDVCAAVVFWKEMAKMENSYSKLEDFFRTHPFSSMRATCLEAHIKTNFGKDCSGEK